MKDLMCASSALMIIVMGWGGLNMINPVHPFMQCTLPDKSIRVLSKRNNREGEMRAPVFAMTVAYLQDKEVY